MLLYPPEWWSLPTGDTFCPFNISLEQVFHEPSFHATTKKKVVAQTCSTVVVVSMGSFLFVCDWNEWTKCALIERATCHCTKTGDFFNWSESSDVRYLFLSCLLPEQSHWNCFVMHMVHLMYTTVLIPLPGVLQFLYCTICKTGNLVLWENTYNLLCWKITKGSYMVLFL